MNSSLIRHKKNVKIYENYNLLYKLITYCTNYINILNNSSNMFIEIQELNNNLKKDNIKLLSIPTNTGSNSFVFLYNSDKKGYIIKLSGYDIYDINININIKNIITEYYIYNYLNILYFLNATPHFFFNYNAIKLSESSSLNRFILFNETSSTNDIIIDFETFIMENQDFLKKNIEILHIIIFQIIYTLECFSRIRLKHNDLHLGNIMILLEPNNIINNKSFKIKNYTKYVVSYKENTHFFENNEKLISDLKSNNINNGDKIYILPNIGLSVRIYDFDRSILYDENNKPVYYDDILYNQKLLNIDYNNYMYSDGDTFANTIPNDIIDLTKFILNIYMILDNDEFKTKILKKIYNDNIKLILDNINNYKRNNLFINIEDYSKFNNYRPYNLLYLNDYILDNNTELEYDILNSTNKRIVKEYSTSNINKYWDYENIKTIINIIEDRKQQKNKKKKKKDKSIQKYNTLYSLYKNLYKQKLINNLNNNVSAIKNYKFTNYNDRLKFINLSLSTIKSKQTNNNISYITSNNNNYANIIIPIIIL